MVSEVMPCHGSLPRSWYTLDAILLDRDRSNCCPTGFVRRRDPPNSQCLNVQPDLPLDPSLKAGDFPFPISANKRWLPERFTGDAVDDASARWNAGLGYTT